MDKEEEKDNVDNDPVPQPNKQPVKKWVGFIRIEADDSDAADPGTAAATDALEIEPRKKSKLTAAQYLSKPVKCKVENRSTKANLNSMRTKFLTVKKKVVSIPEECGVEQDFMLIMKNNLQKSGISNPSPTAGKYMLYTRGSIREQFLGEGVKFNPMTMFMMANDSNYEEEKLANEGIEENAEVEMPTVSIVNNVYKEKEKFSIYNMKAVARKMAVWICMMKVITVICNLVS